MVEIRGYSFSVEFLSYFISLCLSLIYSNRMAGAVEHLNPNASTMTTPDPRRPFTISPQEWEDRLTAESKPMAFSDLIPNPELYDKMRPPKMYNVPTNVSFHITVMGLDSINEGAMTFAADIFFAQRWKDYRLRLPENMTTEYRLLDIGWLDRIWRPDAFFKNAKEVTFQTMTIPNHYLWLYKDKSILYMTHTYIVMFHEFRFECKLQVESLSHTTDDLIFEWEEDVPLEVYPIELPQLQLTSSRTQDCTQFYSTGNFTCLEVAFVLKRRLGYYLFHTYIPTCLIVIMSWMSFWLPTGAAPARVTLGVTSLLTLSTQHAKSQATLPPVSYLKAVDLFMSVCTLFVFLALMEYCLVNILLVIDSVERQTRPVSTPPPSAPPRDPPSDRIVQIINLITEIYYMQNGLVAARSSDPEVRIPPHLPENRSPTENVVVSMPPPPPENENRHPPEHIIVSIPPTPPETAPPPPKRAPLYDIIVPPPPPPPRNRLPPEDAYNQYLPEEQQQRHCFWHCEAGAVDRISRIGFPLTFTVLNIMYWITFAKYL